MVPSHKAFNPFAQGIPSHKAFSPFAQGIQSLRTGHSMGFKSLHQGIKSRISIGFPIPQRGASPYFRATSRTIKGSKFLLQGNFPYHQGEQVPTPGQKVPTLGYLSASL